MISVVVFYYSETLKSMLVEYAATEMGFLDDYCNTDPNHKSIRGNGITAFLFHVSQFIIFILLVLVLLLLLLFLLLLLLLVLVLFLFLSILLLLLVLVLLLVVLLLLLLSLMLLLL